MNSQLLKVSAIAAALFVSGGVAAENVDMSKKADQAMQSTKDTMSEWSDDAKHAWQQGKLESVYMLNDHLSAFGINTKVEGSKAHISGTVQSEAQKELAEELAMSINGIDDVENEIEVNDKYTADANSARSKESRNFTTAISDATTTASVKMKLMASEVESMDVNVDTVNGKVTLSGKAESEVKKKLAEEIAKNTDGVKSVDNKLELAGR